jgi:carbon storage regulator CsrA
MLVLRRKKNETIAIGDVQIIVLTHDEHGVRLGITAPKTTPIVRGEKLLDWDDSRRLQAIATEALTPPECKG